jgi:hypothetical protein
MSIQFVKIIYIHLRKNFEMSVIYRIPKYNIFDIYKIAIPVEVNKKTRNSIYRKYNKFP